MVVAVFFNMGDLTLFTSVATTCASLARTNGLIGAQNAMPEDELTHPLYFILGMMGDYLNHSDSSVTHL